MKNGRTSSIAWIGLPVMVVANFVLRHWLEHAGLYLYDFLPRWYPRGASIIFSGQYPLEGTEEANGKYALELPLVRA